MKKRDLPEIDPDTIETKIITDPPRDHVPTIVIKLPWYTRFWRWFFG